MPTPELLGMIFAPNCMKMKKNWMWGGGRGAACVPDAPLHLPMQTLKNVLTMDATCGKVQVKQLK